MQQLKLVKEGSMYEKVKALAAYINRCRDD